MSNNTALFCIEKLSFECIQFSHGIDLLIFQNEDLLIRIRKNVDHQEAVEKCAMRMQIDR